MSASLGAGLRGGEYLSDWSEGVHPYGVPASCPFCGNALTYTELFYNGYGPPPSYMVMCGHCGAQGPHSHGRERDDHFGAREDAIRQWNNRASVDGSPEGRDPQGLDAQHDSAVPATQAGAQNGGAA